MISFWLAFWLAHVWQGQIDSWWMFPLVVTTGCGACVEMRAYRAVYLRMWP